MWGFILQNGVRMFVVGYTLQGMVKLLGSMSQLFKRPQALLSALCHPDNRNFGAFLGTFAAVFQARDPFFFQK